MPAKGNPPLLRLTRHERWQTTLLLDAATGNAGLRGDHHAVFAGQSEGPA